MDERLVEMVKDALVLAGELAYVEGAYGASAVIERFDSLFRYLTRAEQTVSIADELKALRCYAFVQHTRHRIVIEPCEGLGFVRRNSILRFLDECCVREWDEGNANAQFTVRFVSDDGVWKVQIDIEDAGAKKKIRREMLIEQIE